MQRFCQECFGSRRRTPLPNAGIIEGGNDDRRNVLVDTVEIALQIKPGEIRHVHVHDQTFGLAAANGIDELARGTVRFRLKRGCIQKPRQSGANRWLVVHNGDAYGRL